jgi:hypothetical protein
MRMIGKISNLIDYLLLLVAIVGGGFAGKYLAGGVGSFLGVFLGVWLYGLWQTNRPL